jgi:uncharacterized protein DUF4384
MRLRIVVSLLTIALSATFAGTAFAQQDPNDEEGVRGSFLTSRPPVSAGVGATSSSSASSNTKSGNTASKNSGRNTGRSSRRGTSARNTSKGTTTIVAVKNNSTGPIGLGYTLYMRNALGDAVRIDPSREFRAGDRIRLSMESNTDGYLYVFHTENDQPPTLIFPDARLNDGDNTIQAHVPYEVPSPFEASENLRWFAFDERPAVERLYVVITREPLPGTPIGADLVRFCREDQSRCPLRMLPSAWTRVKLALNSHVRVSKSRTYGQTQTSGEREATTRGLGLSQSAPEPSVVRMSVSTTDSILVTALDLIHR